MIMKHRLVLLSFDVEEFDIPIEYGQTISWEEQIFVSRQGMKNVMEILDVHGISTTLFITAKYALENITQIETLALKHEIASHSYYHSCYKEEDLLNSRLALEQVSKQKVQGLRMPRMKQVSMNSITNAGYTYDASINPTYIPGRYNNLKLPTTVYKQEHVFRVPSSVTPHLRIPLFWITFKNFPYFIYKRLAIRTLNHSGFLNLYFHPWEFTDLSKYKLPAYIKRDAGKRLLGKLDILIRDLKKEGHFESMTNFLSTL